jgi:hypothetical protein
MIDFPSNPTVGQQFTAAGVTWQWDGTKWLAGGLASTVVGGINPNRLDNGDMWIDVHNAGAMITPTVGTFVTDRWLAYINETTARFNYGQNYNGSPQPPAGFQYYLGAQSLAAHTPIATDLYGIEQGLECDMIGDCQWGTANAQPMTLSFWVCSSLTGTFSGCIQNGPANRSYVFSYSIPTANTWTKVVITIPGDTGGTWVLTGSGVGMYVCFDLGSGANGRRAAGTWVAGAFAGATGAVNVVATNGAKWAVTGVKWELGNVATAFPVQSLDARYARCARYFNVAFAIVGGYNTAGNQVFSTLSFPAMRVVPTMTFISGTISYTNCSNLVIGYAEVNSAYVAANITATGTGTATFYYQASAEI